jgi:hypothetical protein
MKEVVAELPEAMGPMKTDTVTLAVEISAKGTVSLPAASRTSIRRRGRKRSRKARARKPRIPSQRLRRATQ